MPINAKELRIGNYIQTPNGLATVQTIANMRIGGTCLQNGDPKVMQYKDCEPIKLTEDWLDRLGFQKSDDSWWNSYVTIGDVDGGFYFSALSDGIVSLTYVHQLQNLAYAINQIELALDAV